MNPAWLPDEAFAPLGRRRVALTAPDDLDSAVLDRIATEVEQATRHYGGSLTRGIATKDADLCLTLDPDAGLPAEGFTFAITPTLTDVRASDASGLLYGLFEVIRRGEAAFGGALKLQTIAPATSVRMLDHWDNIAVHPVMGQVERGYAGESLWFDPAGHLRDDLSRVRRYARLLASIGINNICVNNVNVHALETTLLTTHLDWVAVLAGIFRPWGVRVHMAVNFNAPMVLGGLATSDPCDPDVQAWWARTAADIYAVIPDFGGFVVKADSEGEPGPFAWGRTHADGANCLAKALKPFGGTVHWRAFVYNHRQDWRDRTTDRARAAYDHFTPLDGCFDDNVAVQVKYGPIDFQVREPASPLLAAMPHTAVALELQVTQEYTGQQRHVYYLPEQWHEIFGWHPWDDDTTQADVVTGHPRLCGHPCHDGGIVGVSNVGTDEFWTGHPLAQANLYGFGRLAWDPTLDPTDVLDEWISLTFPGADPTVATTLQDMMLGSRAVYESYTAPLGLGFMVTPQNHYGPSVDGYEYSPWGTYHFADRDGIGVDRTRATGTGYTGQYHRPWSDVYESANTCPDDLLGFFHHVSYDHVLRSGKTVIQHVYDTHFEGAAATLRMRDSWTRLRGLVDDALFARVAERLDEQVRSAAEWRDQIIAYFWRHSGIPDAHGHPLP